MAAYGSLVSLMHIIDQLQHHPSPPISLDKLQLQSLTQTITFLQEFLEGYSSQFADSEEADPLEIRIVKAAYEAEDVIESYIVANIKLAASKIHDEQISCINFYQDLQRVIEEMDVIKKVAMEIPTEKAAVVQDLQQLRKLNVPASVGLNNETMVGFDEVLLEILHKLTAEGVDRRQVIPIVGMGGIGKTTLARNLYAHPHVKKRFDICVWVTISQQFNAKQILCEVLSQANKESRENMDKKSEGEVQLAVHRYLWHRRFLIVMDDMWSIDPWNKVEHFFPDDNNGSRILVTTRLSQLGSQLDKSNATLMKFLDEDSSWALFSQTVFGGESFPVELVEIGKKIVESCKGLPLSIAVIGGLLKKLQQTQDCWESIWKNLNSALSSESDEYCLKILKMSYNHLPAHLKPCFLYMGVFEEDCEIRVPELVRLWICEGFVKPLSGKSLKTTAKEYLRDLVGRNLLVAHELKSDGRIKYCKIHDLLREVCLREAQKEKFYHVLEPHSYPAIYQERCIVIPKNIREEKVVSALQSMPHARSLICHNRRVCVKPNCGLLRSLLASDVFRSPLQFDNESLLEDVFELVNLRYLAVTVDYNSKFPSSINLLWNLHTLIVSIHNVLNAPPEIWKMSQLRHVDVSPNFRLPDPPRGNNDIVIMENLQTLMKVRSFKCSEEVVQRIPNIKKLHIEYGRDERISPHDDDYYCLNNLSSLHKLENFWCYSNGRVINKLTFPQSLQKLTLFSDVRSECQIALEKIGSLPLLRKLVLLGAGNFKMGKWETVEGEFRSLKFLLLHGCIYLQVWEMADCSHFPRLEHLVLEGLPRLKEIPCEIGEIATLKSVELRECSESAVKSMKKIVEVQEEEQGEQQLGFHVQVVLSKENEAVQRLASPNFKVKVSTRWW